MAHIARFVHTRVGTVAGIMLGDQAVMRRRLAGGMENAGVCCERGTEDEALCA